MHVYTNADLTTYLPQCLPAYLPTYVCTYVRTLREYMKAGAIHTDFACLLACCLACLVGSLLTFSHMCTTASSASTFLHACIQTQRVPAWASKELLFGSCRAKECNYLCYTFGLTLRDQWHELCLCTGKTFNPK